MITVEKLIKKLEKIKDKKKYVVLSSDTEGNSFSNFSGDISGSEDDLYNGEERQFYELSELEDMSKEFKNKCKKAVVLWPN